jgi:hypothetical protein
MSQFEYLSVLISIIVGLALTQLLSGAARLIQLRHRVPAHATTYCWMALMFLVNTQMWWAAFERRGAADWNFFSFLLYLLMPIIGFLLSYLLVPPLDDNDTIDLSTNFAENRPWFFGLLALLPCVSMAEEAVRSGGLSANGDTAFRVVFATVALVASRVRSPRFQFWNALFALVLVCGYVAALFLRLR